jgi:MFS family permease
LQGLKEGFSYAFGFTPIRDIILLLALVSLMGMPYVVLMPIFASKILHGGPQTLGFLMAATGIGAVIGAVYLASRKTAHGLGKIIVIASIIFGVGLVAFSLSKSLWLSVMILVIIGFGMMVQMASSNTVLQTIVDDDKRGRVMSFYAMSFMGTAPLGSLLAGTLADKIGAPNTLLLSGLACILGAILFARRLPTLTKMFHQVKIEKEIISEV